MITAIQATGDTTLEKIASWLLSGGAKPLLIVILALVGYLLFRAGIRRLSTSIQDIDDVDGSALDQRTETIFLVIHGLGFVVIVLTTIFMLLREFDVDITPLLASAGIVGLAIGMGSQTLVKDVVGGLFILIENQFNVGDMIEVQGVSGNVIAMSLRATILQDFYGTIHTIPNGEMRVVSNLSTDYSRAILDVGVVYETDIEQAIGVLNEIGQQSMSDKIGGLLLEHPEVTGVEALGDWQVTLRLTARTSSRDHFEVQRYWRLTVKSVFEQRGIEIAFPRQEVVLLGNAPGS